jgi:hypothetical protein
MLQRPGQLWELKPGGHIYLSHDWDLLPAVYIPFPELFNQNLNPITSAVEDLEDGTLLPADVKTNLGVNMSALINFKKILFDAWREIPV